MNNWYVLRTSPRRGATFITDAVLVGGPVPKIDATEIARIKISQASRDPDKVDTVYGIIERIEE